ncbi:hypothetical protein BDY17DRAFT_234934, partial [Neohortaea acidophila]
LPELWNDNDGNCLVYLFPRSSGKGPSFRIDTAVFASSPVLTKFAFGDSYTVPPPRPERERRPLPLDLPPRLSLGDLSPPGTPKVRPTNVDTRNSPASSQGSRGRLSNVSDSFAEVHLYLPINFQDPQQMVQPMITPPHIGNETAMHDLQTLIDIRNFFAFLCGQSLVATDRRGTFFHIFMAVAGILKSYQFSNLDGSTFGEAASSSFDCYVDELRLADVRSSREKTIEGVVLGERMKSVALYNEAFTHAAGKLEELANLKSAKFALMSSVTDNRLIRASMDLEKRIASVKLILDDFEFPALFKGYMSSKTSDERKEGVRFDSWKEGFLGFRKTYLAILKSRYGDWPPKAKSKKNDLETSGLNRLVLRDLYADMCAVYNLLVDRTSLTSRTTDGINLSGPREEPTVRAIRIVLSEYDRSSPPVKPPVPFDLPIFPTLRTIHRDYAQNDANKKKDLKMQQKKLRDDDLSHILLQSWNKDALANPSPFLQQFWEMEKRTAHGCSISELVDLRIGQWIFVYVVLQALPMLACDAPGVKWTKGVEYFLCEPPRKGVPWANPNMTPASASNATAAGTGRTWFAVGEGANVVSLPADVVEHGVEGIYRRSHCWVMAEKWTQANPIMNEALHEQEAMNAAAEMQAGGGRGGSIVWAPEYTTPDIGGWRAGSPSHHLLAAPDSRPTSRTSKRNSSLGFGLEALPLPSGVMPDGSGRPWSMMPPATSSAPGTPHAVDSSKTFDAILGSANAGAGKKGRK